MFENQSKKSHFTTVQAKQVWFQTKDKTVELPGTYLVTKLVTQPLGSCNLDHAHNVIEF